MAMRRTMRKEGWVTDTRQNYSVIRASHAATVHGDFPLRCASILQVHSGQYCHFLALSDPPTLQGPQHTESTRLTERTCMGIDTVTEQLKLGRPCPSAFCHRRSLETSTYLSTVLPSLSYRQPMQRSNSSRISNGPPQRGEALQTTLPRRHHGEAPGSSRRRPSRMRLRL